MSPATQRQCNHWKQVALGASRRFHFGLGCGRLHISCTIFPAINRESAWDSNDFLIGLVWEIWHCVRSLVAHGHRAARTRTPTFPPKREAMGKTRLTHVHRQNTNVLRRRRVASQVKARLVLCRPCKLAFVIKLHSFISQSIVLVF